LARIGTTRFRHGNTVLSVAFSPDGKTLAGAGFDGVRLWEVATGKQFHWVPPPCPAFRSLTFFPHGKTVAGLAFEGKQMEHQRIYLLELSPGKAAKPVQVPIEGNPYCFAIAPGGKLMAFNNGPNIVLWDRAAQKPIHKLEGHISEVRQVAFSTDGKKLASLSARDLFVWDLAKRKQLWHLEAPRDRNNNFLAFPYHRIAFQPAGNALATVISRGNAPLIRFWNATTGEKLRSFSVNTGIGGLGPFAFAPDGKTVALASQTKVCVLEAATGKHLWSGTAGRNQFCSLAFSPDGRTLAAGLLWTVRIWDAPTGTELSPIPEHRDKLGFIVLSADGQSLITDGHQATLPGKEGEARDSRHIVLRYWDAATGRQMLPVQGRQPHFPPFLALSRDGKFLVSRGDGTDIIMWDLGSGKELYILEHTEKEISCAFSPDANLLVSRSNNAHFKSTLRLWDVRTGKFKGELEGHEKLVRAFVFSPDSKTLAASGDDGTLRLWDIATRKENKKLLVGENGAYRLAFSPNGQILASAGYDQQIRLWNVVTGKLTTKISSKEARLKHKHGVHALAFSPDGKTLASSDIHGAIFLWDLASGQLRREWKGHLSGVTSLAFAADGKRLASLSGDGMVLVWDMPRRTTNQDGPARPSGHER
jgi:WD40 repeat protein